MIFTLEPLVIILSLLLFLTIVIGIILFYPIVGLFLLFLLEPFQSLVGEMPIKIFPILGATVVAGYLLTGVIHSINSSKNKKQFNFDYVVVLIYMLWIIMRNPASAMYYEDPTGKSYSIMFTYIQLAVLYYLSSRLLRGGNLSWMALGLMLGTTLSALYGLSTTGIGGGLLETSRLAGAQGDPNNFATYALCSLALLPAVQKLCKRNWQLWTVTLMGAFQLIIVFLTMSKTGLLALGLLIMLWLSFFKSGSAFRRNILIGGGILLVLAFFIPAHFWVSMYEKITGGILEKEGTMGSRYHYWQAAFLAFKSAPIWGIGVGQFRWFTIQSIGMEVDYGTVVHNSYLTVLAEDGIVGLSLFLGWITLAIYRFWVISKRGKTERLRLLAFSGFCGFAMVLFMALTLSIEYYKILWLLAGSSLALTMDNETLILRDKRLHYPFIPQRYNGLSVRVD